MVLKSASFVVALLIGTATQVKVEMSQKQH